MSYAQHLFEATEKLSSERESKPSDRKGEQEL